MFNIMSSTSIIIREDGTRHRAGCDESSGWIWHAARQLESTFIVLLEAPPTTTTILEVGSGTEWLPLQLALRGATVPATERSGCAMMLLTLNVMSNQERINNLDDVNVQELEWNGPVNRD
jgi:methylase of polypeptide subunit release factors